MKKLIGLALLGLFLLPDGAHGQQAYKTVPPPAPQVVAPFGVTLNTYSASDQNVMQASITDAATLCGSTSKIVRVLRVEVSGIATTAVSGLVKLQKRTAANTGGTTFNAPPTPHDASFPAATAVVTSYTANAASLGAPAGSPLRQVEMNFQLTGATSAPTVFEFTTRQGEGVILRGVASCLTINFPNLSVTGGNLAYSYEWTEE